MSLPVVNGKYYKQTALSPDGNFLVTVHDSLGTQMWRLDTGKAINISTQPVYAVIVSSDSRTVVLISPEKAILWDVASSKAGSSIPIPFNTKQVWFSPDGQWLYSGTSSSYYIGSGIWLWHVGAGQPLATVPDMRTISDFAVLPDGNVYTVSGPDSPQRLWNSQTLTVTKEFNDFPAVWIAMSPSGKWLATTGVSESDNAIRLYDFTAHKLLANRLIQDYSDQLLFDGDDKLLSLDNANVTRRWDLNTFKAVPLFTPKPHTDSTVSYRLLTSQLALLISESFTSNRTSPTQAKLSLVTILNGKNQADLGTMPYPIDAIVLSPDEKTLAIADKLGMRLYDTHSGALLVTLDDDISTKKLTDNITDDLYRRIAFSPDGKLLASSDRTINLWDVATGKKLDITLPQYYAASKIAFSPDGSLLITNDGTLRFYGIQ